jgi:hypothetical protein
MTTNLKDFKVKNGLVVTNGGSFGNAVAVGEPTLGTHATTKDYVDSLSSTVIVANTAPLSPISGKIWFDTTVDRLKVYNDSTWNIIETFAIPDHIHDTSIDGSGLITDIFWESITYDANNIPVLDGGTP